MLSTFSIVTQHANTIQRIRNHDVWTCRSNFHHFERLRSWSYVLITSSYIVLCLCIVQLVALAVKWILELTSVCYSVYDVFVSKRSRNYITNGSVLEQWSRSPGCMFDSNQSCTFRNVPNVSSPVHPKNLQHLIYIRTEAQDFKFSWAPTFTTRLCRTAANQRGTWQLNVLWIKKKIFSLYLQKFEHVIMANHAGQITEQSSAARASSPEHHEPPSYISMRVLQPIPYQHSLDSACPYHSHQPPHCHHCDNEAWCSSMPRTPGRRCHKIMPY